MGLARLIFVTGKGGSGKSVVAASLAVALSRRHHTTLADLDERFSAIRALSGQLSDTTRGPDNLELVALSSRAELEAFVSRIVPLKAIARRMLKSRTFGYVTAALPGLEAFLMLERLRLMADTAAAQDGFAVVDAPPTGNALELLGVAGALGDLAPLGTLHRLSAEVKSFLNDEREFGVVLTLRPEDLAIRETVEAAETLRRKIGIRNIICVLNGIVEPLFTRSEISRLNGHGTCARLAERRFDAAESTRRARRELRGICDTVIEIPMLFEAKLGLEALNVLATLLEASGLLDT